MSYIKNKVGIVLTAVLVVVLSFGFIALADVLIYGGNNTIYEDSENQTAVPDDLSLGAAPAVGGICQTDGSDPVSQLCNVNITHLETATSTQQRIILGSDNASTTLNFDAGATTTPGGVASFQWDAPSAICGGVILDIDTGGGANSATMVCSVATSTAASSYSDGEGASAKSLIITTSTIPTSTTPVFNSLDNAGLGLDWFEVANGDYFLVTCDTDDVGDHASSSAYSSMDGALYLPECFIQQ